MRSLSRLVEIWRRRGALAPLGLAAVAAFVGTACSGKGAPDDAPLATPSSIPTAAPGASGVTFAGRGPVAPPRPTMGKKPPHGPILPPDPFDPMVPDETPDAGAPHAADAGKKKGIEL